MQTKIDGKDIQSIDNFLLQTQGKTDFDKLTNVLVDFDHLPSGFPAVSQLPYNQGVEIEGDSITQNLYVMKVKLEQAGQQRDALLIVDNGLYELSEEQVYSMHFKQVAITVSLIVVSLFAVAKISKRLAQPVSTFVENLANKDPEDTSTQLRLNGHTTLELQQLINTFNSYQSKIEELIERERSFNRYSSHELRSPLMVIRGAATLLGESNDPEFVEKQRQRLFKATNEMSEFIETLLSLTKPIDSIEQNEMSVNKELVNSIIESHIHMIENKLITWQVCISQEPRIVMPLAAFQILLGNLIKNAFAYTDEGEVIIKVNKNKLSVIDTGKGVDSQSNSPEGFGLGLLLVRDVCQRFGYQFELDKAEDKGSIATIFFTSSQPNHKTNSQ